MYEPPLYVHDADDPSPAPWERPMLPEGMHLRQLAEVLAEIDDAADPSAYDEPPASAPEDAS